MANELTNEIRLTAIDTFRALKPAEILFGVYHGDSVTTEQQLKIPISKVKIPKHLTEGSPPLQDGDSVILLQNLGAAFYVILGAI